MLKIKRNKMLFGLSIIYNHRILGLRRHHQQASITLSSSSVNQTNNYSLEIVNLQFLQWRTPFVSLF